jgi:hypothetical protein
MTPLTTFPVSRLRLTARATDSIRLADYAGSQLRGAFGAAYRQLACLTRQKTCSGCPISPTCPYRRVFESEPPPVGHALQQFSQVPHPYVIEPPPWGARTLHAGDTFDFHMVLVGQARPLLPLILAAWQRALAHGLGKSAGTATLLAAHDEDGEDGARLLYAGEGSRARPLLGEALIPPSQSSVRLEILTPLRLQNNSRPLGPDSLSPRPLLTALVRRLALLAEFHTEVRWAPDFQALAQDAGEVTGEAQLGWRDWTRYSSRQQQEMSLGGVVGTWNLYNLSPALWPALWLGQWLHAGKNTTFGLGHYRLKRSET